MNKKNKSDISNNEHFGLIEKRKHPRFLLSGEQFRETKSGKVFSVYDLSQSGLSIKIEDRNWKLGAPIQGILNLHLESIEISPRLIEYYGDRAALKFEALSTYAKGVLNRVLSPKRLGSSLKLIKEKLPLADFWYHGACNTDLLIKLEEEGALRKIELFFSNYFCTWDGTKVGSGTMAQLRTGHCQSLGKEQREDLLLSNEPVKLETIQLDFDLKPDPTKQLWAKGILEATPLDSKLKSEILKKFDN